MPWVRVRVHLFCSLIHRDGMAHPLPIEPEICLLSTKEYVCSMANVLWLIFVSSYASDETSLKLTNIKVLRKKSTIFEHLGNDASAIFAGNIS